LVFAFKNTGPSSPIFRLTARRDAAIIELPNDVEPPSPPSLLFPANRLFFAAI
jgi:hypothetical protein